MIPVIAHLCVVGLIALLLWNDLRIIRKKGVTLLIVTGKQRDQRGTNQGEMDRS